MPHPPPLRQVVHRALAPLAAFCRSRILFPLVFAAIGAAGTWHFLLQFPQFRYATKLITLITATTYAVFWCLAPLWQRRRPWLVGLTAAPLGYVLTLAMAGSLAFGTSGQFEWFTGVVEGAKAYLKLATYFGGWIWMTPLLGALIVRELLLRTADKPDPNGIT